jgi:hypothetical protein
MWTYKQIYLQAGRKDRWTDRRYLSIDMWTHYKEMDIQTQAGRELAKG